VKVGVDCEGWGEARYNKSNKRKYATHTNTNEDADEVEM